MRRREFVTLLGGAAIAGPGIAIADPNDPMRRIGVLMGIAEGDAEVQPGLVAFRQLLEKLGWTDGSNVRIEYRFAVADRDRIRAAAAELVGLKPDVLLAQSTSEASALREQTHSIPIVCPMISDPIGAGLVENLARPGGNVTGFTNFEAAIGGKWLGLLKEIAPDVTDVAIVLHPNEAEAPSRELRRAVKTAASSFAVELTVVPDAEIQGAIDAFARKSNARTSNGGLIVFPDIYTRARWYLILALAAKYSLPAIYPFREYVKSGGLMSYGIDTGDVFRGAASYVDRILRGAKPGDLPVQATTKFQLVISVWAAKALGLTIPDTILARADEVIE